MSLPTRPMTPALAQDLTDAEFAELDELLAATPEPLEPLDAVMLDGYLCGVIVQPVLLQPDAWLPHVFDFDATPLPDSVDPAWLERTTALILRRHTALNRAIVEDGWFDPLVLEPGDDEDDASPPGSEDAAGAPDDPSRAAASGQDPDASGPPTPEPTSEADDASSQDDLSPISQALLPWVAGFQHATIVFPDLSEMPDDAVMESLARLFRHLPVETDEEREIVATLDREYPLATLDDAMEELVVTTADLQDLTSELRYRVETVRRETPKVGRNEPCPCGSGKKYKQCHGAA